MQYREWAPHPTLRALVHCYWELVDQDPGQGETILPDGSFEIVWHRKRPPLERRASSLERRPAAFLMGEVDAPVHLAFREPIDCFGVRFRPGGLAAFVPIPVTELAHATHALDAVLPPLARASPRLLESGGPARAGFLDSELTGLLRSGRQAEVSSTCRLVRNSVGHGSVSEMAREAGVSVRQLQRRVGEALGVPPKRMLRLLRFNRAVRGLLAGDADAALAAYYDQAHLLRDFREFAGGPPSRVLAGRLDWNRSFQLAAGAWD